MKRLTYRSEIGSAVSYGACQDVICASNCNECKIDKIISKLCAYEDTGLTPEEIMALIATSNDPLTLDELRQMDGEPVWVELRQDGTIEMQGWALVEVEIEDVAATNFRLDFETYGEGGWMAYRRKPEKFHDSLEEMSGGEAV